VIDTDPMTCLHLAAHGRFEPGPVRSNLIAHAVPGGQRFDAGTGQYTRLVTFDSGAAAMTVRPVPDGIELRVPEGDPKATGSLVSLARFWFDLDTDLLPANAHLLEDPVLAPLVRSRPGLRVTRSPDGFEAAISSVIGQQISVVRGRTLGSRLLELCGSPGPAGLTAFPSPERLAAEPFARLREGIGLTRSRARTVLAVAGLFADGFTLGPGSDPVGAREALLAVPGVGPWTAEYLAVRAIGDPDAFPAGDAVLRRALDGESERNLASRAAAWSPWRSYAAVHLWAAAVYGGGPSAAP